MTQPAPDPQARLVIYLPESARRRVRSAAALAGLDTSAYVRSLIDPPAPGEPR